MSDSSPDREYLSSGNASADQPKRFADQPKRYADQPKCYGEGGGSNPARISWLHFWAKVCNFSAPASLNVFYRERLLNLKQVLLKWNPHIKN